MSVHATDMKYPKSAPAYKDKKFLKSKAYQKFLLTFI